MRIQTCDINAAGVIKRWPGMFHVTKYWDGMYDIGWKQVVKNNPVDNGIEQFFFAFVSVKRNQVEPKT